MKNNDLEDEGEDNDKEHPFNMVNNPFTVSTDNKCPFLDYPKKLLHSWIEREGYKLEYNCLDVWFAKFKCTVVLLIQESGKKEAFIQCALEAWRIYSLDR